VESFGSYSTGLLDCTSDLDLVVCFSDECNSLLGLKGVIPLLHLLAEYLTKEAGHLIQITNIFIHARVPIIKAVSINPLGTVGFQPLCIDISIDCPQHSGLATTEMVCTLMQALPPLGPVVAVLKAYLKSKGLNDSYTGGLNRYIIILNTIINTEYNIPMMMEMVPYPFLTYYRQVSYLYSC
jgi:DNA polymerase sigma